MDYSAPEALRRLLDPAIFGGEILRRNPFEGQLTVMRCPHPRQIVSTGRDVGKSQILCGDGKTREAAVLPDWLRLVHRLDRPMPVKIVMIGAVLEHALALQEKVRDSFDRDSWLRRKLSADTSKTNIRTVDGAQIIIRPATNAARGQHASTELTARGVVGGPIIVVLEEGWFIQRSDFLDAVVNPMLGTGGPGSKLVVYTTPYGEEGPIWSLYSGSRTGDCEQPFTVDEKGFRHYQFDRSICQLCLRKNYAVRHNMESHQNPYLHRRHLLDTKRDLFSRGLELVWKQEYLGIPVSTAGLFFKSIHQKLMFDPDLPEYAVTENGEFVCREVGSDEEGAIQNLVNFLALNRGKFFVGIDGNSGSGSERADFAAIALTEQLPDRRVRVRMCQRFRKAPGYFNGKYYAPNELAVFLLDLAIYLIERFEVRTVYIDQGYGQQYYVPLSQKYGAARIQYIASSQKEKNRCFLHFRGLIERNREGESKERRLFGIPEIAFLMAEAKYLREEAVSEDEDKIKISKPAHGLKGKTVDGLFAVAYSLRGTEAVISEAQIFILPQFGGVKSYRSRREIRRI